MNVADLHAVVESAIARGGAAGAIAARGAEGAFLITPYAVSRYIERVRPGLDQHKALAELVELTSAGRLIAPYVGSGLRSKYPDTRLELWRGPRVGTRGQGLAQSRVRFVVAYGLAGDGAREHPHRLPQVVTVLPVGPKVWTP